MRCLQTHAQQYKVEIEHDPDEILIIDEGGHSADMPAFLRARLDACARELGFGWREHLTVHEHAQEPEDQLRRADQLRQVRRRLKHGSSTVQSMTPERRAARTTPERRERP